MPASPARCLTGTFCGAGFFTFVLSLGFSANCVAMATPEACSLRASLIAVNAAVWGLILIIVGGMCLAFNNCFRIEPAAHRLEAEERLGWKPKFGRLSIGDSHKPSDDGMISRSRAMSREPV
ncbi:hypothetical protein T492DRAFT_1058476 [Pavlovales sp. CCMP2436]|nr:hypothetical protein T492DRAFT_1058476 [Pavlovales sp. CCMP2436]|mmetsp:Transcript_42432/g.104504  ORF Transcript_42432/g.104504 Transcript_42432/m.104504 type:complete len:122 (-) Transcript_42432:137-502(-)